jgi:D-glycero-D-manno-heptose 1,7-bisphosphate phosphatase
MRDRSPVSRENLPTRNMRAVFLDRDGVINPMIYHRDQGIIDSPFTSAQFTVMPRVPKAIRRFNDMGFLVVIVSNQPGIAKLHFDLKTLHKFDRKLNELLKPMRARIDATYYCMHHPNAVLKAFRKKCSCRKPMPGMLLRAAKDLDICLADSYMIGDGLTDIEAGNRAGCRTVFVGRWKCECCQFIRPHSLRPSFVAKDLWEAAKLIQIDAKRISRNRLDNPTKHGVRSQSRVTNFKAQGRKDREFRA